MALAGFGGEFCAVGGQKDRSIGFAGDKAIAHEALKNGDVDAIGTNGTSWMEGPRAKDESVPYGVVVVE